LEEGEDPPFGRSRPLRWPFLIDPIRSRSATNARIAAAFAANVPERRSSEVMRTAIGAVHHA